MLQLPTAIEAPKVRQIMLVYSCGLHLPAVGCTYQLHAACTQGRRWYVLMSAGFATSSDADQWYAGLQDRPDRRPRQSARHADLSLSCSPQQISSTRSHASHSLPTSCLHELKPLSLSLSSWARSACASLTPESCLKVPAGCLPRTMEVILRNNLVESVRAGDKVVFVGNLIVVPDVAVISAPGERVVASAPGNL